MNYPSLQAETYTSASECLRGARDVRARLLRPANAYRPSMALPEDPKPAFEIRRPVQHDYHIRLWRRYLAKQGNKCRFHIEQRADEMGLKVSDILGLTRRREIVEARQLLMWEIKTIVKPEISLPEIGRLFGRDHTTVLHAIRKVAAIKARAAG